MPERARQRGGARRGGRPAGARWRRGGSRPGPPARRSGAAASASGTRPTLPLESTGETASESWRRTRRSARAMSPASAVSTVRLLHAEAPGPVEAEDARADGAPGGDQRQEDPGPVPVPVSIGTSGGRHVGTVTVTPSGPGNIATDSYSAGPRRARKYTRQPGRHRRQQPPWVPGAQVEAACVAAGGLPRAHHGASPARPCPGPRAHPRAGPVARRVSPGRVPRARCPRGRTPTRRPRRRRPAWPAPPPGPAARSRSPGPPWRSAGPRRRRRPRRSC